MDICICLDTVYRDMGLRHRSLLSLIVLQTLHRLFARSDLRPLVPPANPW